MFVSEVDYLAIGCAAVDFTVATSTVAASLLGRSEIIPSKNLLVLLATLSGAIWLLIEPAIAQMVSLSWGCREEGGHRHCQRHY